MVDQAVVDTYPLSPLQLGMLFHHLEGSNLGVDIEQLVGELGESIDVRALRDAWQHTADRHPILRTAFRWVGVERPMQVVSDQVTVSIVEHDWRQLTDVAQREQFEQFMVADRLAGFDMAAAPMWRLTLFHLGENRERFVFTYHHSLLDISVVWVAQEAFQAYDAARAGVSVEFPSRRPYKDHILWLDEHLESNRAAAQDYFRALLDGFEEPTRLTALRRAEPPADDNGVYGARRFLLPVETSSRLHQLGATGDVPLPAIIEAAWGLVIASFSGMTDVVFGSTRGCRRSGLPGTDTTVGLFINTPPVRLQIDPSVPVDEFLRAVRRQQVDKRPYEHTPLTDIQAALDVRAAATFDTIVVINELHQGTRIKQAGPQFDHREFDLHDQTNFPLTLLAYTDPQIRCKLSYDRQHFDEAAMERVEALLVDVLTAIVDNPGGLVGEVPRVSAGEREILRAWNATDREYDSGATIGALFEAQVDRTPDAVALAYRDQRVTYRELDQRANAVAAELHRLGVGPDDMVGVFVERSVEMVAGLLGILKAGAAYVPMDPNYPAGRVGMMLEDSHADVVLTHSRLRSSLPGAVAHVIELDRVGPGSDTRITVPDLRSDHLAYVIFTSGSTGRPKGVMIEHRNVANFFVAMDDQLGHTPATQPGVWLGVTSISFDISVLELFWTLTRGFLLVLQEDDARLTDGAVGSATRATTRPMDFSIFYFASDTGGSGRDRYRLLIEGAKFADQHGFAAVWTPERHFHEFGGIYPNAALTSAAVAMVTERISIRAGSVVLPLHNPIRCAEDWSVVDNLSNGRVGLSFASGWHANDFALAPANFANRRTLMSEGIETIKALWRGESVTATNGEGRDVSVKLYPPPVQTAPPTWITAGGSPETFAMAGRIGANILTNLLVMGTDDLVKNIAAYREAYRAAGHAGDGHVSVMLHTFIGNDLQRVREIVREPFLEYLRTSTDLINQVQWEQTSFAKGETNKPAGGAGAGRDLGELSDEEMAVIMDHAFDRYFQTAGLFGTPESCVAAIDRLSGMGVDEVACLIDFGVADAEVLASLTHLDALRGLCEASQHTAASPTSSAARPDSESTAQNFGMAAQIARHGVTHLQCTPSLAAVLAAEPEGLAAIATLDKLLLGGEALPPALVDRVRPAMRGELLNMYGPTETTIWSTVSPIVEAGAPITIGRPIANTQIHIVDANRQPNPIGAPGELLIGGDGVVRGYLDRAELTADRFVTLPGVPGRVYRTGDLARLLPNGEIEFSGRLDHQVKIRGYRIELGEIEAAIGRFPDTYETVVVARTDTPGDPRLVAYVVPKPTDDSSATDAWGEVWNETYRTSEDLDPTIDPTFNIAGWNNSYSGEPIPADEMRQWVDLTVERILGLAPKRALEIGCGTGLLLFRIAPNVERYFGVDLAQSAIDRIGSLLPSLGLANVGLARGQAHEIGALIAANGGERFDTIVINSVAQYFPDADFLVAVIEQAMHLLEPGGRLFLGDLRSRQHLPQFAAAIELSRAPANMLRSDLATRAAQRAEHDEELVIDPALFLALQRAVPALAGVRFSLKPGSYDNEMTRFRYDAILTREGGGSVVAGAGDVRTIDGTAFSMDAIRVALADGPAVVRVTGVVNDRLVRETQLVRLLTDPDSTLVSVADVRSALGTVTPGVHPHDLEALHPDYHVDLEWSHSGPDRFDVVLRSRLVPSEQATPFVAANLPWSAYTNQPAVKGLQNLVPELRNHLRTSLPDYMVPTAFVVLDALPRTPNGKIDRNALPAPDRSRVEGTTAVAPESDIERTIAGVWQDMLALDAVGVETNLFDLGANSLMMVQANSRLREALSRNVSLVEMFRFPTVRSLAEHLDGGSEQVAVAMQSSQDRGQTRKDAMQRRREARQGARPDRGR